MRVQPTLVVAVVSVPLRALPALRRSAPSLPGGDALRRRPASPLSGRRSGRSIAAARSASAGTGRRAGLLLRRLTDPARNATPRPATSSTSRLHRRAGAAGRGPGVPERPARRARDVRGGACVATRRRVPALLAVGLGAGGAAGRLHALDPHVALRRQVLHLPLHALGRRGEPPGGGWRGRLASTSPIGRTGPRRTSGPTATGRWADIATATERGDRR